MTTRIDMLVQKHPDHEEGIRALAGRDPSNGKLKYLDWSVRVLVSGQALAGEITDVIDLFHKFAPGAGLIGFHHPRRRRRSKMELRRDLYSYRPQEFTALRDCLFALRKKQDQTRKKRERLYKLDENVESEVIYADADLIVRHIRNKAASVHYGGSTKWCISMLREQFFEEYDAHNATFFFFERTPAARQSDAYDKVALMLPREGNGYGRPGDAQAFTALDAQIDPWVLAGVYGPKVFDIFKRVQEVSAAWPGSATALVYAGTASAEQIETVFARVVAKKTGVYETSGLLESICCNDAAPWALLERVLLDAKALWGAALARHRQSRGRYRRRRHRLSDTARERELARNIEAALAIHPATPADVRVALLKKLCRDHINTESIRRQFDDGRIIAMYERVGQRFVEFSRHRHARRRRYRRSQTARRLFQLVGIYERLAIRTKKRAEKKAVKEAATKARAAAKKAKLEAAKVARAVRAAKKAKGR